MARFRLVVVLLFFSVALCAQQFGGNPASTRWLQINTDTVRVIFPEGYNAPAQRVAAVIHSLQRNNHNPLGDRLRKISIVLHDQTLLSNAYVGLGPYRSEFYLTAPQDPFRLGAVSWADQLAVHEYRHVQQYGNFNRGLSRVASVLAGEEGQALANAAAIPDWFFEGDAVYQETKLTRQGRGVLPLFMNSYRSLFDAGKTYTYQQLRNGSLRKYIPDHYALGYLLVAYGRAQYGEDIWQKITADAAAFKPLFYPFQGAVKKHTGVAFTSFTKNAFNWYHQQWTSQETTNPAWLTGIEENTVNDYLLPFTLADGNVLALKNSYRRRPAFYRITPDGQEQRITVRDIAIDDHYSFRNGMIVYSTYYPDERWGYREFTDIKTVNSTTGEETVIASKTRLLSPDISPDHQRVVAVHNTNDQRSSLVVMNINGEIMDTMATSGITYSHPKFSANGEAIYTAARNEQGEMSLLRFTNGSKQEMLPWGNHRIGYLNVQGDTILMSYSYQERDEIWAVIDRGQKPELFRLASLQNGLYQATLLRDGILVASAFTADGYRLVKLRPQWTPMSATEPAVTYPLYMDSRFPTPMKRSLDDLGSSSFAVSRYRKSHRLINIHSWRPYFEDPDYSFTLYGQNVLNTLRTELGYTFNYNESSHQLRAQATFGGWYLQPYAGVSQTWHRTAALSADSLVNWNESNAYAGLQLPLNLTSGRQFRYLTISGGMHTNKVSWTGMAEKLFVDRQVNYLNFRLSYAGQVQKALQQINPQWGQSLYLQYRMSVNQHTARQFLGMASLYLPGLSGTHSLVVTAAYQGRDTLNNYYFSNNFPFARGYNEVDYPRMWKLGANYHLPLAYPEWGFGHIVYFLRVRTNLFYDYSVGKSLRTGIQRPFNTVGAELYFDTRWWNQHPVTFGIRYNYLLNRDFLSPARNQSWELILPVNLF